MIAPMWRSCLFLVMFLLLLPQPLLAQTTVNFEQYTGPSLWGGVTSAPVTDGIATFSGGALLDAVLGLPADQTTVYGTTGLDNSCTGCLPTITIDFSQPVSNVSLLVLNGQTVTLTYTVQDNAGGSPQVLSIVNNSLEGQGTFTLPGPGITQVTVTSNAPLTGLGAYDFFIDNVQFSASASAVITTFASGFNFPFGVAVDATTGDVYVADRNNHKVRRFNSLGVEQLPAVAGTGEAGYNGDGISATTAQLDGPRGVAVSNGNLFIADSGSHIVRKVVLSSGMISTVAGIPQKPGVAVNGGPATLATLFVPTGVATDAAGNVYIADSLNQQIRKVIAADGMIVAVAGVAGVTGNNNGPVSTATLNSPLGVAVNSAGTLVYVADEGNNLIRGVNAGSVFTVVTGQLDSPAGVVVAAGGTLYIADTDNHLVLRFSGESVTTVAGNGTAGATAAQLNMPVGVAVDSTGRFLYIADLINNRIQKVDFGPPIIIN